MTAKHRLSLSAKINRMFLAGILTIIPVAITYVIVRFLLDLIIQIGEPVVTTAGKIIRPYSQDLAGLLFKPWFSTIVAIIIVFFSIIAIGFVASRVFGKRLISWFDNIVDRIPFIKTVYGASKKLVVALEQKPDGVQRVVLIDFPHREMKAIGFVTRTFIDEHSGRSLAAVYVPTTPNPTSGYLEIVPMDRVISTNWSIDEAMTFIVSGGAVAPEKISIEKLDIVQDIKEKTNH